MNMFINGIGLLAAAGVAFAAGLLAVLAVPVPGLPPVEVLLLGGGPLFLVGQLLLLAGLLEGRRGEAPSAFGALRCGLTGALSGLAPTFAILATLGLLLLAAAVVFGPLFSVGWLFKCALALHLLFGTSGFVYGVLWHCITARPSTGEAHGTA